MCRISHLLTGFECVIECQIYCINKSETKCELAYNSKIGSDCVIECQIYCIDECKIAYQSKIVFECGLECQIY